MTTAHEDYDLHRAVRELAMARKASEPAAIRIHQELAALYLERSNADAANRVTLLTSQR